ncbi:MAG: hypothetical protein Q4B75_10380 [Eubacteriales bacterium]|nr:hypothetical protein [Eubacteriales bacterium]
MSGRERILAIQLMEKAKERPEFFREIGVKIEFKKVNKQREEKLPVYFK